jgi:peroxiredoxin
MSCSGLNSEFLSHQRDANAANLLTSSISTLLIILKKFMGREYMGIVRSTFIIDAKGNILKAWDKVKVKGQGHRVKFLPHSILVNTLESRSFTGF